MENQKRTYGQVAAQGAGDIVSRLSALLQPGAGGPMQMGMNFGQGMANTEVGQNPFKGGMKQMLSPYQKGLEKALKTAGEAHATEALASGVTPQHIEKEAGLAAPPPQLTPQQMMSSPVGQFQAQMGQPVAGLPNPVAQEQAGVPPELAQSGNGPLKNLFKFLYNPGQTNLQTGQVEMPSMLGGLIKPAAADQAQLTAAAQIRQSMAGMEPLQLKDALTIQATLAGKEYSKLGKMAEIEQKIASKFYENRAIKDYTIAAPRYETLRELVMDPVKQNKNGYSDLAIINETLKIVDPESVNREGEVDTWSKAEARLNRAGLKLSRSWRTGEKLTQSGREAILRAMTTKFKHMTNAANSTYQGFAKQIEQYGGDPRRALVMNRASQEGVSRQPGGKAGKSAGGVTPSGLKYTVEG